MDNSDIVYILALTRRDLLHSELNQMLEWLLVTTSRLTNLRHLMRTLEMDLQIPESDSSSFPLKTAQELLFLGKEAIEKSLKGSLPLRMPNAATTSGSSTTKSSPPVEPAKE